MYEVLETPEFTKWFKKLRDRTARVRILDRLERVELGNLGDHKSLGEALFELRLTYGPAYRLYFTIRDDTIVVLLMGGDKSTQDRDIQKAREILEGLNQ
ncbi:MAG: type II toxin-antitoxin system RelE/ParE family toxin [Pseudomonadota bacterium]